jgi:hypothetical protein
MSGSNGPRLVIATGPRSGEWYPLRVGEQTIGRADTAQVVLGGVDVSRNHARIRWDGSTATITDAGSSNGTVVNGYRLFGAHALRPGDMLRLGSTELRYEGPEDDRPTGPLQLAPAGNGGIALGNGVGHDNYGEILQAGRDLRYDVDYNTRLEFDDPMDELFKGRGFGRLLMAIGLVIALAGFAGWMVLILSGFTRSDGNQIPDLFEAELFGLPAAMVAFGSFALGGVIAAIGKGMSKAARERAERAMEMRRMRAMAYR